jgi:ankyrin repeat protein
MTALLIAAGNGHLVNVKWLLSLEGGSYMTEALKNGKTAHLLAADGGHLTTIQWLLSPEGGAMFHDYDSQLDTIWRCSHCADAAAEGDDATR